MDGAVWSTVGLARKHLEREAGERGGDGSKASDAFRPKGAALLRSSHCQRILSVEESKSRLERKNEG